MINTPKVVVSPRKLETNDVLTIRAVNEQEPFRELDYKITDEAGRIIRKGPIANGIHEFKLCIVGFKSGVYRLSLGQAMEYFTVL